jgi:hypothetical protein
VKFNRLVMIAVASPTFVPGPFSPDFSAFFESRVEGDPGARCLQVLANMGLRVFRLQPKVPAGSSQLVEN